MSGLSFSTFSITSFIVLLLIHSTYVGVGGGAKYLIEQVCKKSDVVLVIYHASSSFFCEYHWNHVNYLGCVWVEGVGHTCKECRMDEIANAERNNNFIPHLRLL